MPEPSQFDPNILLVNDQVNFLRADGHSINKNEENDRDVASELEENIRQTIEPFIEKIRQNMPLNEEIGGYILDGQLVIQKGDHHSFVRGDWKEVRNLAEKGAVTFHTHPSELGSDVESPADIQASYVTLGEAIFTENNVIILVPEKIVSVEEIKELAADLIKKSDAYDEDYYPSAYWCWSDLIRTNFPVKKSILSEHVSES